MKKSLIQVSRNEEKKEHPQTVHIVFGDSTAGSLKFAFRKTTYAKTEEIIVLPDILSVGPIESLQTKEGIENRFQWFKENYRDDFKNLEEYKQGMLKAIEKIIAIPPYQKVIIWTCENAAEQTGLRIVLYLLQNKVNDVFELNTFKAFHEFFTYPMLEEEQFPRSSGELTPEKLLQFYEQFELRPMNFSKRNALSDEGQNLMLIENHLRTWEHGELRDSNIERGDDFIIHCAKKLHKEQDTYDYMKSARLIGEVIGHMQQYTGDEWIEYRLRDLISKEIFEYRGDLSAMRLYEVKLKKVLLH
ncbi:DUF1835 domain-containing protein [Peribacillus butanolivorans]|uniref:DUF1835 domain-containing protein n=1 Tax=Peribacillus butanolivorans TaxID=421767 RepID=UPI0036BDB6CF